jgi:wyosine [tRNA(Phe)-imidazoG37] synthetase (radical SAM superfamily)
MGTFLFDRIIFGPVYSRRLGQSLGLNLLPTGSKICTFNCVYCECGWTKNNTGEFVSVEDFRDALTQKLILMNKKSEQADAITFAGNGEPTLHPEFDQIIDITVQLRQQYMPDADIAVLSNSTTLDRPEVFSSLQRIEKNIMKLDTGSEEMYRNINQPNTSKTLATIVNELQRFQGNLIIQTLLVKGQSQGKVIDNTSESELFLLGNHLQTINPHTLMLYSIARGTPLHTLQPANQTELQRAGEILQQFVPDCNILLY